MSRSIHITIKNFRGLNRKQFDEQKNNSDSELHQWSKKKGIKADSRKLRNGKIKKQLDSLDKFNATTKADNLIVWNRIDEILWHDWDPIGINDVESARDEYQNYIGDILEFKLNGTDVTEIANYLSVIETQRMNLLGNKEKCFTVAQKIQKL